MMKSHYLNAVLVAGRLLGEQVVHARELRHGVRVQGGRRVRRRKILQQRQWKYCKLLILSQVSFKDNGLPFRIESSYWMYFMCDARHARYS